MKLKLRAAEYKFSGKPIKYENIEIECPLRIVIQKNHFF